MIWIQTFPLFGPFATRAGALVVNGALTSTDDAAIGNICRVALISSGTRASVTLPSSAVAVVSIGTNRISVTGTVRTSSGTGVPDDGYVLSDSSTSRTVLAGSTSTMYDNPLESSPVGRVTPHEPDAPRSSTLVATDCPLYSRFAV